MSILVTLLILTLNDKCFVSAISDLLSIIAYVLAFACAYNKGKAKAWCGGWHDECTVVELTLGETVTLLVICFQWFIWFTFAHEFLVLSFLTVEQNNNLLNVFNKGLDLVHNK